MRALVLSLALVVPAAHALETPTSSPLDTRIRTANYHPQDVIALDTVLDVATHVVLQPGERYVTHVVGDSDLYAVDVVQNNVFIKPVVPGAPTTNLMLVTDRRSYAFKLTLRGDKHATYRLELRYPEDERQSLLERARAAVAEREFERPHAQWNLAYSMAGDLDIGPVNAWDDGVRTFLKFAGNRDLPAVYQVDASGNEALVNRTTEGAAGEILVLHRVNPRWTLRIGDRALAIFNDAFDPHGVPNTTGTASPGVERVLREGL